LSTRSGPAFCIESVSFESDDGFDQILGPMALVGSAEANSEDAGRYSHHYVAFTGNLRHGVVAKAENKLPRMEPQIRCISELRLTLLVNYWHRRPRLPIAEYDGAIYHAIRRKGGTSGKSAARRGFAA